MQKGPGGGLVVETVADYVFGMRAALAALVLMVAPAHAAECAFYNQSGQRLVWDSDTTITVDPLYTDAYSCKLTKIPDSNGYKADCGGWSDTFVVGTSTPYGKVSDVVVWQAIFFWYQCAKDKA